MSGISIEVSEDLLQAIKLPPEEVLTRLKRELALRLYERALREVNEQG